MKLLRISSLALLLPLVGCGLGDDKDAGGTPATVVESGTYTSSNTVINAETCAQDSQPSDFDDATITITVSGNTISMDETVATFVQVDLIRTGGSLSGSATEQIDFNEVDVDCILDIALTLSGTVVTNNVLRINDDGQFSATGPECSQLSATFPCELSLTYTLTGPVFVSSPTPTPMGTPPQQ